MKLVDLSDEPRRILIIKPSALGDIVHGLPVLNLLRRRWPTARIDWLISSTFVGLIEGHPQLNQAISFDRRGFASSWRSPSAALRLGRFVQELADRKYDLIVDLQGLLRTGILSAVTGAAVRVGFAAAREAAPVFYTDSIELPAEMHAVDRNLAVCAALGCESGVVEFPFVTEPHDEALIDELTRDLGRFAVLLPGTNWQTKRWPAEKFGRLIGPLRERFGFATVLAGAADAAAMGDTIPATLSVAGKTNLRQLVALLKRASLVIANDSGPMHIAAALGRPLVTIFGPTSPIRTGPYRRPESVVRLDLPCSPCYSRRCTHISCMNMLEIENVLSVAKQQLRDSTLIANAHG